MFSSLPFGRAASRPSGSTDGSPDPNTKSDAAAPGSWILADEDTFGTATDVPEDLDLQELNDCLHLLVAVFPDVQVEVFREMLLNLSKQSRVEVVTEQLLKDKGKWVKGRYRTALTDANTSDGLSQGADEDALPRQETFRSKEYRDAVKEALYREFKGLSHATIKAVMAEHNFSYTECRPALQLLSTKSWRFYFSNMWRKQGKDADVSRNPLVNWQTPYGNDGPRIPYLRGTQSRELNRELWQTVVAPVQKKYAADRFKADAEMAVRLNEEEAALSIALLDCECCYDSVTFEDISTCNTGAHLICRQCIRSSVNEAVFGQGWAKSIDMHRGTLRCIAPCTGDESGCWIKPGTVSLALLAGDEGEKVLHRYEEQMMKRALEACSIPLQRCPFCSYAEFKEDPPAKMTDTVTLALRLVKRIGIVPDMSGMFFWIIIQPLLIVHALLWVTMVLVHAFFPTSFKASRERIQLRRRGLRFRCQSSKCSIASCSVCLVKWSDPHVCYESTTRSLRHAVEAATTAVIKRTCPRCNTGFVKSTGCNKLVCPCGYAMCYLCRSAIGKEAYAHFCQHFRPLGGRCTECSRCDLYAVEDEEAAIRSAALEAEKAWRKKEGMPQVQKAQIRKGRGIGGRDRLGIVTEEVIRGSSMRNRWSWEGVLDEFLEMVLA